MIRKSRDRAGENVQLPRCHFPDSKLGFRFTFAHTDTRREEDPDTEPACFENNRSASCSYCLKNAVRSLLGIRHSHAKDNTRGFSACLLAHSELDADITQRNSGTRKHGKNSCNLVTWCGQQDRDILPKLLQTRSNFAILMRDH